MTGLSTTFSGLTLQSILYNASGPKDVTYEELAVIGKSRSSAILIKSTTLLPRTGNPEPRYYSDELGSINSMGLPNLGYQEYCALIPRLKEFGKPVIASVAGFSTQEYLTISTALADAKADALEINLSCPNIEGKAQAGYDFDYCRQVLAALRPTISIPMGVKLPPYLEIAHQKEMASILQEYHVDFITLINSPGNALIIDPSTDTAAIKPKKGLGGLGGKYIKPITLGNIWSFYQMLGGTIPIIGCGGVYTGRDAYEHLLCGAQAVQVGTAFYNEGPSAFDRIERELVRELDAHGYASARDAIGKLKTMA